MKRSAILITFLLFATAAFAQGKFQTKMFEVHNRPPRDIYAAIHTLGSGVAGSEMTYNNDTHTITVRDYPENIAALQEAIARLDRSVPPPPMIDLKISLLIGAKTPLPGPGVPDDLAPVVKQLQATLRYSHYGLMAAVLQNTTVGDGVEGSGVAEPTLVGMAATEEHPVFYNYRLKNVRLDESGPSVNIENFEFSMRVPVRLDKSISYQGVGFHTPVSIHEGEKVVIGTTTMGDRAVIVVLMANVSGK